MSTQQIEKSAAKAAQEPPTTIITPRVGWVLLNARELWDFRELLYFLAWRDVTVRYKQTLLGVAWAILQPAMMMVVFTIFLGRLAQVDSGSVPYPVFVYAGLLPWTFFATAISNAGNSVVGSAQMVSKVYFPRLFIPLASVAAAMVDFLVAFFLMAGLMLYYGIAPGWPILLLPALLGLAAVAATGVGVLLAALNVSYRDFKYTIPFLVQIWMFATPTVYMNIDAAPSPAASSSAEVRQSTAVHGAQQTSGSPSVDSPKRLTSSVRLLLNLNPMTGLIAFFRAATLGGPLPWSELGYASLVIAVVFVVGIAYFRRVESGFADII